MTKKVSLFIVIILVLSSFMAGCGKEKERNLDTNNSNAESYTLEGIKNKGKLVMGTSADYPPFEFHAMIEGKDQIVGFDVEVAKYIADKLGVELEVKEMDFEKLLGGLSTGMLDIVAAGMNPDPEREKEANFTDIYYEADLAVLINKADKSNIITMDDLNEKRIGVQIGTIQENIAKTDIKNANIKSLNSNPDIVMNLKTRKIDCAIMETLVAKSFANTNDDLMMVEGLNIEITSGGVAIALKKGNDQLTQKLNEILAEAKSKGLLEQWLLQASELSKVD